MGECALVIRARHSALAVMGNNDALRGETPGMRLSNGGLSEGCGGAGVVVWMLCLDACLLNWMLACLLG